MLDRRPTALSSSPSSKAAVSKLSNSDSDRRSLELEFRLSGADASMTGESDRRPLRLLSDSLDSFTSNVDERDRWPLGLALLPLTKSVISMLCDGDLRRLGLSS